LKLLVLSDINTNFQTKLQTIFEDLGWNKHVTNNVSMNASVALINLKLFFFSIVFLRGVVFFHPNIAKKNFYPTWLYWNCQFCNFIDTHGIYA